MVFSGAYVMTVDVATKGGAEQQNIALSADPVLMILLVSFSSLGYSEISCGMHHL